MKDNIFILVSLVLALIFIVVGFLFDVKDYSINILSELAGLFIGIIVAILLVDRFVENQRRKRWARVRKLTHRTITHHIINVILELFNHFPLPNHNAIITILENRDQTNAPISDAINSIIAQMKDLLLQDKIKTESAIAYYNAIKWDINQIRFDLIPRVMQSSDNQDLIDALVEFDDTTQDLQNAVIMHKRLTETSILPSIISLLESIHNVSKYL